jgi:penicillin-binding protein 1C
LLGAKIADDKQWRFPLMDSVPEKFKTCIVQFEDRYFYYHPGVNLFSIFRALKQNIKSGKITQGGSTITMQTIRLARNGKARTYYEKAVELILALRIELKFSKESILRLYASHAPFGGNIVGLDAAAWRYFGRSAFQLSWAETATLAVLPNAPSLIHPGKNRQQLLEKRNRLLNILFKKGEIDDENLRLALLEPLPDKPLSLPQNTYHLLMRIDKKFKNNAVYNTTIDNELQQKVLRIVSYHNQILKTNQIKNAAAIVIEVETGNVIAYIGNVGSEGFGNHVDILTSPRSTGSILKPFLYACMTDAGEILPNMLVPDIPTQMQGFVPENYNKTFDGAVPAKQALARSLNIPAVQMLKMYGYVRFKQQLSDLGMSTLKYPASHYGLSLILGGAEGSLSDIAGMYASCSRILNNYYLHDRMYNSDDIHAPVILKEKKEKKPSYSSSSRISAGAVWLTYKALLEVNRPEEDGNWEAFSSSQRIAWKTGTSFGFRDAWAIGTTSKYVVGVWCGNADGEGRPGLIGVKTAAPILFDIFNLLPKSPWFEAPYNELREIPVCRQSGHRVGQYCTEVDTIWVHKNGLHASACPYHKLIHLDKTQTWQVSSKCETASEIVNISWFVLPPVQEWYYKHKNPFYKTLPPFRSDCIGLENKRVMEFVFPKYLSKVYIPNELNNQKGEVILEATHRDKKATIYWHLDGEFIGATTDIHQMAVRPYFGKHTIIIIDGEANSITTSFEVLSE